MWVRSTKSTHGDVPETGGPCLAGFAANFFPFVHTSTSLAYTILQSWLEYLSKLLDHSNGTPHHGYGGLMKDNRPCSPDMRPVAFRPTRSKRQLSASEPTAWTTWVSCCQQHRDSIFPNPILLVPVVHIIVAY